MSALRTPSKVRRPRFGRAPRRVAIGAVLLVVLLLPAWSAGSIPSLAAPVRATPSSSAPVPAAATHPAATDCAALAAGWAQFDAGHPAPDVAAALQSPCAIGRDVPAGYLVSNVTGSGSHARLIVTLPPNGTTPASSFASFWVGLWLTGVPCSYGGLSYLTIDLLPPYALGTSGVPHWTVEAPVWDLVPAGSCDPQCTNDSAFFTIAGRNYCEDDAMLTGVGALSATGAGDFAPGDILSIDLVGVSNRSAFGVYLNDTSAPSHDLAWNYSLTSLPGVTYGTETTPPIDSPVAGRALSAAYSVAGDADGGWTGGLDVGFGWQDCPVPAGGASFPSSCNSYNAAELGISGSPSLVSAYSWNASKPAGYRNEYPVLESRSSSGGCSGLPEVAACADFTSFGGSGSYPTLSVVAHAGRSAYTLGAAGADAVSTFGGTAREFPSNGSLSALEVPTIVSAVNVTVGAGSVTLTARVSDPNGVARVLATSFWCGAGGVRLPHTAAAALVVGPYDTTLDGNWSVALPTASLTGVFYYSVTADSNSGAVSAPFVANASVTGSGGSCGAAQPPTAPTNLSSFPIAGGYTVNWTENASQGVTAYQVLATPVGGGATVAFPFGNVSVGRVTGLTGNASYHLEVAATNPGNRSSVSGSITGTPTYYPFAATTPVVNVSSFWVNQTSVKVTDNVTGGDKPYNFQISFGDGTNTTVWTTSGDASATHLYSDNFTGNARVFVRIVDILGDAVDAPVVYVPVQATPLAVPATIAGGTDFAYLGWTAPVSPVPIFYYQVLWTTNASLGPYVGAGWPTNASVPTIHVALSPASTLHLALTVADGTTVYAQVFAVNKYGPGLLPATPVGGSPPVLSVTPGAFTGGPIVGPAGGAAPFVANFSAPFSTPGGTSVVNATYRFSGGGSVVATIAGGEGTYWANASFTFETPGAEDVYVYALDSVSEIDVLSSTLLITPGPTPLVNVTAAPTPIFVNSSVALGASATGGSGHYAFAWTLGDGTNATGSQVNYSYAIAGTYIVAVTTTDLVWGGVSRVLTPLVVHPIPVVEIAATSTGSSGTFDLTAVVVGGTGNFTFTWLYDDGTQGSGSHVIHTWTTPGTFHITLQATDQYGHTVYGRTNLTIAAPATTSSGGGSGGYPATLVYGLVAGLVVAAGLAAFFALRRRPAAPTASNENEIAPYEAPPSAFDEEKAPLEH